MRRRGHGFTLVEVLVAMALVGIFFAGVATVVSVVIKRRQDAEAITETSRLATAILDIMSADLWGAYLYNLELEDAFTGEHEGEYLHFVTTSDSRLPVDDLDRDRQRSASSITEISYMVKENSEYGTKELYRREDYYIDGNLKSGGAYTLLYEKVLSLRFTFLEQATTDSSDQGAEPEPVSLEDFEDTWKTDRATGLPRTVRIELVLRVDIPADRSERDADLGYKFTRLVELPGYNPAELALTEADPDLVPIPTSSSGGEDEEGGDGTGGDGTGQGGDGTGQGGDGTGQGGDGTGQGGDGTGQGGDGTGQGGDGQGGMGQGGGGQGGGQGGGGQGGGQGGGGQGGTGDRDGDGIPDDQDDDKEEGR